eukprot:TRINITY_DN10427_c0_g1_i1.p1 TRINITY_DN10427_c0_g1~~TRINITY_DN10427_c0_g1_i1.p1  ORF type:complete len:1372 (+),score=265.82 TRINITY_DN10427_c0_g1_i1:256-4116(+)
MALGSQSQPFKSETALARDTYTILILIAIGILSMTACLILLRPAELQSYLLKMLSFGFCVASVLLLVALLSMQQDADPSQADYCTLSPAIMISSALVLAFHLLVWSLATLRGLDDDFDTNAPAFDGGSAFTILSVVAVWAIPIVLTTALALTFDSDWGVSELCWLPAASNSYRIFGSVLLGLMSCSLFCLLIGGCFFQEEECRRLRQRSLVLLLSMCLIFGSIYALLEQVNDDRDLLIIINGAVAVIIAVIAFIFLLVKTWCCQPPTPDDVIYKSKQEKDDSLLRARRRSSRKADPMLAEVIVDNTHAGRPSLTGYRPRAMTALNERQESVTALSQSSSVYDRLHGLNSRLERADSDHFDDLNDLPFRNVQLHGDKLRNPIFESTPSPTRATATTPRASPRNFQRSSMKRTSDKHRGRANSLQRSTKAKAALLKQSQLSKKRRKAPRPSSAGNSPVRLERDNQTLSKTLASQRVVESLLAKPPKPVAIRPRINSVDKSQMNVYQRRKMLGESSRSNARVKSRRESRESAKAVAQRVLRATSPLASAAASRRGSEMPASHRNSEQLAPSQRASEGQYNPMFKPLPEQGSKTSMFTAQTQTSAGQGSYLLITTNSKGELQSSQSRDRLIRDFDDMRSASPSPRASQEWNPMDLKKPYVEMELRDSGERRRLSMVQRDQLSAQLNLPPKSELGPYGDQTLKTMRACKPSLSDATQPLRAVSSTDNVFGDDEELPPPIPPRHSVDSLEKEGRSSSMSNRTASLKSAHLPPTEFFDIEMQWEAEGKIQADQDGQPPEEETPYETPGILRGLTQVDRMQNESLLRANRDSRRQLQLERFRRSSSNILLRGNISLSDELGKGAFGFVKKGKLRRGSRQQLIAAKALKSSATVDEQLAFLQEAEIMSNFSHGNVLRLIGVINSGKPVLIIMELMEGGSLYRVLRNDGLTPDDKIKYACHILCGLEYIHSQDFIHRDLASRNILIGQGVAKIADFGFTRRLEKQSVLVEVDGQLPVRWCSPEALNYGHYSKSSDIWAIGVLLYEIWSGARLPYKGWSNLVVATYVGLGHRLPPVNGLPRSVYVLMIQAWHPSLWERPTANSILERLYMVSKDEALRNDLHTTSAEPLQNVYRTTYEDGELLAMAWMIKEGDGVHQRDLKNILSDEPEYTSGNSEASVMPSPSRLNSSSSLHRYDPQRLRRSGSKTLVRDHLRNSLMRKDSNVKQIRTSPLKSQRNLSSPEDRLRAGSPISPLARSSALRGSHRNSAPTLGSLRRKHKPRRMSEFDQSLDAEVLEE